MAIESDNPHPLYRQKRCELCKAGEPYTIFWPGKHALRNSGYSQVADCAAPTESAYIAELEAKVAMAEGALKLASGVKSAMAKRIAELDRDKVLDTKRLDWLEKNADGMDRFGCGSDDTTWQLLFNDGNLVEQVSIREAIDSAMAAQEQKK